MSFESQCADCIPYICGAYPERTAERYACALRGCSGAWSCGHPSCAQYPNCAGYSAPAWNLPGQVDWTTPYVTNFLPGLERVLKPGGMTAGKGCGCGCGASTLPAGTDSTGGGAAARVTPKPGMAVFREERRKFNCWWVVLAIILLLILSKGARG